MNVLLDPSARCVIAHRGDSAHAPENTMEAFTKATQSGADAIELDVQLTRDGAVVVMHDADVNRTTDGLGPLASLTLREARELDAGAWFTSDAGRSFPYRARRVRIPTLDEVLDNVRDAPLLIEIKEPDAAEAVAAVIKRHAAEHRVVLASEHHEPMQLLRAAGLRTGASRPDALRLLRRACLRLAPGALGFQALCIPWRVGLARVPMGLLCRTARHARVPTHVWTVNSERLARRLWRAGVNGLITDDPQRMVRLRGLL